MWSKTGYLQNLGARGGVEKAFVQEKWYAIGGLHHPRRGKMDSEFYTPRRRLQFSKQRDAVPLRPLRRRSSSFSRTWGPVSALYCRCHSNISFEAGAGFLPTLEGDFGKVDCFVKVLILFTNFDVHHGTEILLCPGLEHDRSR